MTILLYLYTVFSLAAPLCVSARQPDHLIHRAWYPIGDCSSLSLLLPVDLVCSVFDQQAKRSASDLLPATGTLCCLWKCIQGVLTIDVWTSLLESPIEATGRDARRPARCPFDGMERIARHKPAA